MTHYAISWLCLALAVSCATTTSDQPASARSAEAARAIASNADSDLGEARALFEQLQELAAAYDPTQLELYDRDAVFTTSRTGPDGVVREQKMPPGFFFESFDSVLQLTKARGDQSSFEDVTFAKDSDTVVVRAKRTSKLKCYVDDGFSLRLRRRDPEAPLRIVAQHMNTQALSSCRDGDVRDLVEKAARPLQGKLPVNLDDETRLDAIGVDDNGLTYHVTLVKTNEADVDTEAVRSNLWKLIVAQSCLHPELRPVLDSGGSVSYLYAWADGTPFTELRVVETDCS